MTVSSSTSQATFTGNGIATSFPLPFRFFDNSEIVAALINTSNGASSPLTLGVNYSLTGAGEPENDGAPASILTLFSPLAVGFDLFVERVIPLTQPTDIVNQGRFFPQIHEYVFDRLTMLIQQVSNGAARALKYPPGGTHYDAESRKITNMADPSDTQDAVTLGWVSTFVGGLISAIQGPINNAINVFMTNVAGGAKVVQNIATGGVGEGDAMVGVKQPTANSSLISQHDVNLQTVSIFDYGGKDDFNGTTGTNCFAALNAIVTDYPNGARVRFPKSIGGTGVYLINGTALSSDMSAFVFDIDPDVRFHLIGSGTVVLAPGLRLTRPTSVRMADFAYTYYLSDQPYGDIPGKPESITAADGEAPIAERIITSTALQMSFATISLTDGSIASTSASTDGETASFGSISANGYTVGSVPIRPGQEVHAQVTMPSLPGKACAFVQTESGWVIFTQDGSAGGSITRRAFLEGFPIQTTTIDAFFSNERAYKFTQSELGIKVHGPRSFSLMINHVEAFRMDPSSLTSDILRAGWGAGEVSNTNPAYITYPVRIRGKRVYGMRPLRVVISGDSTADPDNPFSWANHFRRVASGVGGIQFRNILNIAQSGHTSLQQRDIFNATDFQALGGFDYALVQVGLNDIGGTVPVANTVQAIVDIINRCATFNIIPIIGIPAMFYNRTDALAYGQTGENTGNSDRGAPYRLQIQRKLAELGIQANLFTIENMGAIVPSMLNNSQLNPMVQDNIHPSNLGAELIGLGWAQALIGYMYQRVRKDIEYRAIKAAWIDPAVAATVGNNYRPSFGVREDVFFMGQTLNVPIGTASTPTFGTKLMTLPLCYAPERRMFFNLPAAPNTATFDGPYTLTVQIRVDTDGSVYTQTPVVGAQYINFSGVTWPLKA